jgi:type 1 fimbriae regulatory protein FimB
LNAAERRAREQEASPHVFTSERGGPMSAKSFGTLFARLGERAGMAFPIFPHMLRHSLRPTVSGTSGDIEIWRCELRAAL